MKQCGMMKRVLCLVADGVEELELVAPVDVLRRAGCEVVLAAVGEGIHVTGRNGITLHADTRLDEVVAADFEALLLPGGPAVKTLMEDERVLGLCRKFAEEDKGLAAICAAPLILDAAGLLAGRHFTAHASVWETLEKTDCESRVVVDGRLITSRGAATALEFALELAAAWVGPDRATEVAVAMGA